MLHFLVDHEAVKMRTKIIFASRSGNLCCCVHMNLCMCNKEKEKNNDNTK